MFSKFHKMKIGECKSTLFLTLNSMEYIRKLNSDHFLMNFENSSFSTTIPALRALRVDPKPPDTALRLFFPNSSCFNLAETAVAKLNLLDLAFQKLHKPTFM